MRRFVAVFIATVAGLVVLLSFKTASTKSGPPLALSGTTPGTPDPASSASSRQAPSAATPTPSASSASPAPSTSASATKVVTGTPVAASEGGRRVFGTVSVRLTITNGKITAATVVTYPNNDARSSQISSFAIPVLNSEVLAAQGANINAVSGATITSEAYAQSLQAALDQAKV
jgi:uncharacterized protein with FMN-binding domain